MVLGTAAELPFAARVFNLRAIKLRLQYNARNMFKLALHRIILTLLASTLFVFISPLAASAQQNARAGAEIPPPPEPSFAQDVDTLWDLQTNLGAMTVRLFTDVAPNHAANLVHLVSLGYYDGLFFHRVIPGFMAQGGGTDTTRDGGDGPRYTLEQERNPGLTHDRAGLVSMVADGERSDTSRFFITLAPTPWLDERNTIFGQVVDGMETLRAIERVGSKDGATTETVKIEHSTIRTAPTALAQATAAGEGIPDRDSERWRQSIPAPQPFEFGPGRAYNWHIETSHGVMRFRLAVETAPRHVGNLLYLSALHYYDGLYFHRVIPGFMAQGGGILPNGPGPKGAAYTLSSEASDDLHHDRRGRVSMVAQANGTSDGGQFFITLAPTPWLDKTHTVVGTIVDGFDALTAIERLGSKDGKPAKPIPIVRVWTTEETARKPPEDAVLSQLRTYIDGQQKAGKLVPENEGWRRRPKTFSALSFTEGTNYFWHLETSLGLITIRFLTEVAPSHVSSFLYLAEVGYFDGLDFHRVIPNFMAQGGHAPGGPGWRLPTVSNPGVRHDRAGIVSMANTGQPNTEGSDFFITFQPTRWLDGKHTIFGEVINGMKTVREMEKRGSGSGKPKEPLLIQRTWITAE